MLVEDDDARFHGTVWPSVSHILQRGVAKNQHDRASGLPRVDLPTQDDVHGREFLGLLGG